MRSRRRTHRREGTTPAVATMPPGPATPRVPALSRLLPALLVTAWASVAGAAGPRAGAAELRAGAAESRAGAAELHVEPGDPGIEFTLGATFHTIEGTLAFTGGRLSFDSDSGAMSGRLVADATSAQTGNDSRDRKMHAEILESATYPVMAFLPTRFTGTVPGNGEADLVVSGILEIHGGRHEVEAPVHVRVEGEIVSGTARLTIPYVAWGMKNPSVFLLRVHKEVEVTVTFQGVLAVPPAGKASDP